MIHNAAVDKIILTGSCLGFRPNAFVLCHSSGWLTVFPNIRIEEYAVLSSMVLEGTLVWSHCPNSGIHNGRSAKGVLIIQGIVFFRARRVPNGVDDIVGPGR